MGLRLANISPEMPHPVEIRGARYSSGIPLQPARTRSEPSSNRIRHESAPNEARIRSATSANLAENGAGPTSVAMTRFRRYACGLEVLASRPVWFRASRVKVVCHSQAPTSPGPFHASGHEYLCGIYICKTIPDPPVKTCGQRDPVRNKARHLQHPTVKPGRPHPKRRGTWLRCQGAWRYNRQGPTFPRAKAALPAVSRLW